MKLDIEVKPCPFCGCEDIDYFETDFGRADDPYSYAIRCNNCNARVFAESGYFDDAIEIWNRRA